MGATYPRIIELLKEEFEVKATSKYTFCKKTGINPTSVERYLCGISEPNQASLKKLADYFEVSVAYLRGELPVPAMLVGWINEAIEKLGIDKLSEATGVLPESLQAYSDCERMPTESDFVKLSVYFKEPVNNLRGGINKLYMKNESSNDELLAFEGLVSACGGVFRSVLSEQPEMSSEVLESLLNIATFVREARTNSQRRNNKLDEIRGSAEELIKKYGALVNQKNFN